MSRFFGRGERLQAHQSHWKATVTMLQLTIRTSCHVGLPLSWALAFWFLLAWKCTTGMDLLWLSPKWKHLRHLTRFQHWWFVPIRSFEDSPQSSIISTNFSVSIKTFLAPMIIYLNKILRTTPINLLMEHLFFWTFAQRFFVERAAKLSSF